MSNKFYIGSQLVVNSSTDMTNLGEEFGEAIKSKSLEIPGTKGTLVALIGGMGTGKTTFIQGVAIGLGVKTRIVSPTFIIMKSYHIESSSNSKVNIGTLYHVDLYRVPDHNIKRELETIGFYEAIYDHRNLVMVEWADKLPKLERGTVVLNFSYISARTRKLVIDKIA